MSPSGVALRPFRDADTEGVVALWDACGLLRPWNDPRKDIARKLAVQRELFLVGCAGDAIVAAAMAGYDGHRGWVYYFAVAPAHRRRGVGRALLAEIETRLRALGCPKINLQVRGDNAQAIAFWRRVGFARDDTASLGKRLEHDGTRSPAEDDAAVVFENDGTCPICERAVRFVARGPYLRNDYRCSGCDSLPRERALMHVLARHFPRWRELAIHESSPGGGASPKLARECPGYVASQWWPDAPRGAERDGVRCEDLERLTFADERFDLHVTQDVLEHLFDPDAAFREIARTLRPGGAHVFTVPLVRGRNPSLRRARREADGHVVHEAEPKFHDNPVDPNGSLVTMDWGWDVCDRILRASGLATRIVEIDELARGIRGELGEVLVSIKAARSPDPAEPR